MSHVPMTVRNDSAVKWIAEPLKPDLLTSASLMQNDGRTHPLTSPCLQVAFAQAGTDKLLTRYRSSIIMSLSKSDETKQNVSVMGA